MIQSGCFDGLHDLEMLNLSDNEISKIPDRSILNNIYNLDLSDNNIDEIPEHVKDMGCEILWSQDFDVKGINLEGNPVQKKYNSNS